MRAGESAGRGSMIVEVREHPARPADPEDEGDDHDPKGNQAPGKPAARLARRLVLRWLRRRRLPTPFRREDPHDAEVLPDYGVAGTSAAMPAAALSASARSARSHVKSCFSRPKWP